MLNAAKSILRAVGNRVSQKCSFKGDGQPMRFVISGLRTHSKSFGAEIV